MSGRTLSSSRSPAPTHTLRIVLRAWRLLYASQSRARINRSQLFSRRKHDEAILDRLSLLALAALLGVASAGSAQMTGSRTGSGITWEVTPGTPGPIRG